MLCERPVVAQKDVPFMPSSGTETLSAAGLTPVKKASCNAELGFSMFSDTSMPCMQVHAARIESKDPDANALHRKWIKEFDATKTLQKDAEARAQEEARAKAESVTAFGEKLRHAVLNGEKVSEFWAAAKKRPDRPAPAADPPADPAAVAAAAEDAKQLIADMEDFVETVVKEAKEKFTMKKDLAASTGTSAQNGVEVTATGACHTAEATGDAEASTSDSTAKAGGGGSGVKKKGKAGGSKPAWALSEVEAEAAQEDEERQLLSFAENLDFDLFVDKLDDVELQDTFKARRKICILRGYPSEGKMN